MKVEFYPTALGILALNATDMRSIYVARHTYMQWLASFGSRPSQLTDRTFNGN